MELRKDLSKANILAEVNQFDIFNCYCFPFTKLYKIFKSELRKDKNPTCSICRIGDKLIYRDFSETRRLDCFDYIQDKYSVSFMQALEMVNQDFNLNLISGQKLSGSRGVLAKKSNFNIDDVLEQVVDIRVRTRQLNIKDKEYWNGRFDISSKALHKFRIYPLEGYFINGVYTACGSHVYGYYFGILPDGREAWKIYQPYADKKLKWRSNCPENVIQGYNQLKATGDYLIITKSLKDVVLLDDLGFNAIAPQAETNSISIELVLELRKRFTKVLLLYDNDVPGIKAAESISEQHDLPIFYMPEGTKDASDFTELYGKEQLLAYINGIYDAYSNNPRMGS